MRKSHENHFKKIQMYLNRQNKETLVWDFRREGSRTHVCVHVCVPTCSFLQFVIRSGGWERPCNNKKYFRQIHLFF